MSLVKLIANVASSDSGLARPTVSYYYNLKHLMIIIHLFSCFIIFEYQSIRFILFINLKLYIYLLITLYLIAIKDLCL